ncbi:MAG: SPFH/Band 7/PHB domain protein [Candidatus Phytoplasma sp.]|nr:SPFH/Band 7/PHB domain protein [Phytoplasma sp.]
MSVFQVVLIGVGALILIVLALSFRLVKQTEKFVVERMGGYHATWGVGVHFLLPFVDRVAAKVSLKEQVRDFEPQPVITKDNVTMQIDTVIFFQVTDPKLYAYGVDNPILAIENLSATTLRNIIGDLDLDETLTSRDLINERMRYTLDDATDAWGIKVNRVEVKNIVPPKDIRESMEKQMRAERERRQTILIAEGEKRAQILAAEAQNESIILKAEADKRQQILAAEAEAEALLKVKQAEADSIRLIKEAKADKTVLTIRALETLAKVADGQSTKIVIPSNLTDITSNLVALTDIVKTDKK